MHAPPPPSREREGSNRTTFLQKRDYDQCGPSLGGGMVLNGTAHGEAFIYYSYTRANAVLMLVHRLRRWSNINPAWLCRLSVCGTVCLWTVITHCVRDYFQTIRYLLLL